MQSIQKVYLKAGAVPAQVIRYDSSAKLKLPTGGRIVKIMCGRDEKDEKVYKEFIPLYMGFDIETTNIIKRNSRSPK